MSSIRVLEYIFFILLLIFAISYLIRGTFHEYLQGPTYFSISQEPITKEDIPTLTICFLANRTLTYDIDFTIQAMTWNGLKSENSTLIDLTEGTREYEFRGQRLIRLKQLEVQQNAGFSIRSCIALHMNLVGDFSFSTEFGNSFPLGLFTISFKEHVKSNELHLTTLWITSLENSHGAVLPRFYDGKVKPFHLQKGGFQVIHITKVTSFEYLEGTCQRSSFYECMGSEIVQKCQENGIPCSPVSVPRDGLMEDHPICQTNFTKPECQHPFSILASAQIQCIDRKPCHVQEYSLKQLTRWSVIEDNKSKLEILLSKFLHPSLARDILAKPGVNYAFWPEFGSPTWSRGKYQYYIQKEVHKEYLTVTSTILVGNIGGHLGLCIGFSFTGLIAWLLSVFPKLWHAFFKTNMS